MKTGRSFPEATEFSIRTLLALSLLIAIMGSLFRSPDYLDCSRIFWRFSRFLCLSYLGGGFYFSEYGVLQCSECDEPGTMESLDHSVHVGL